LPYHGAVRRGVICFIVPEGADVEDEGRLRYIAFDAVEIDLDGRRVSVGGRDVALEPKAFDVLAVLAQAPGKAFSRDELLDAVWGHRHVTPGVLNRVVTLVRHALGENAGSTRYIHTLHGVGYRFDGVVRRSAQRAASLEDAAAADGAASATPLAAAASEPHGPPASWPSAAVAGAPAEDASAAAAPAVPAKPHHRSVSPRLWVLAATLVVVAIGILLLWRQTNPAKPAVAPPPTLVVLPLRVIGDDKGEAVFADGLSEELTTELARVNGLRLIASVSAARARALGLDAAQLAERLHVTHAIEGSLRESGGALRIDLRLIETPSGRTVWAQSYDRQAKDVFGVQQEIAQAVASALTLGIVLDKPAQAPDPQVFREYLELRHIFLAGTDRTKYAQAEKDLDALAARAPDFAPAHALLALNLASDFEGEGKDGDALREARHALALDPNNSYAHATLGQLAAKNHDWATVKKEYDIARALNPSDPVMHNITGMWLGRLGYRDLALAQFETAHAADPLGYWVTYNLGVQLDLNGRHDEAERYLDELPSLENAPTWRTAEARWRNAIWRRDFTAARDIAAHVPDAGDASETGYARALAAVTEALVSPSRWPQADVAIADIEAKTGNGPNRLRLFEPHPNAEALLRTFEPGTQQPDGELPWAIEFAAVRRDPAFQGFLKRMKFIDYWNVAGWPPQCRPEGDGARCD
jgi:TolB-like protein/DNA-binding winged helix-turn-helix (wHTH) protein/Flp pilus assembly protein TadD